MGIKFLVFFFLIFFIPSGEDIYSQNSLNDFFEKLGSLKLDEASGDFFRVPKYSTDKEGNFIVTDFASHHVQIFNRDGEFINKYGRPGQGPGDFERPNQTIRLENGNLLTVESNGKLTEFSSDAEKLIKVYNSTVLPATQLIELKTGEVLIGGRKIIDGETYYLHLFNLGSGTIKKSFLNVNLEYGYYQGPISMIFEMVSVDTYGDKIAAVLAPFSELYYYDSSGNFIEKIQLHLENFSSIKKSDRMLSVEERLNYFNKFSMFNSIHWVKEDELFLQFFRKDDAGLQSSESTRHLAVIKTDGSVLLEGELDNKIFAINKFYKSIIQQDNSKESSLLRIWKYN